MRSNSSASASSRTSTACQLGHPWTYWTSTCTPPPGQRADGGRGGLQGLQHGQIPAVRDDGRPPCDHVQELIDERLEQIEARIAELQATRTGLRRLARRSNQLETADWTGYCHIIDESSGGG